EDGIRDFHVTGVQTCALPIFEREFERFLGAGPWERTPSRRGWRNGRKRRTLKTRLGTLELRVPKDREGHFQPSLFERYQRSEKEIGRASCRERAEIEVVAGAG